MLRSCTSGALRQNYLRQFSEQLYASFGCWMLQQSCPSYEFRPVTDWKHFTEIAMANTVFGSISHGTPVFGGMRVMHLMLRSWTAIEVIMMKKELPAIHPGEGTLA